MERAQTVSFMTGQKRFLAQLLVSLLNAREAEGARISRLLHDDVGQVLSAVGLHLTVLKMDLQDREPEAIERTLAIQNMLEQAVNRVRELSYELNPDLVERVGLHYALERLLIRCRETTPTAIRMFNTIRVPLPVDAATALYRIAEQAVENAVKHSAGTQVRVVLRESGGQASMEVRDNGKGFAVEIAEEQPHGLGLLLMRLHAERSAIQLTVRSSAKKGTIIRAVYMMPGKPDTSADGALVPPRRTSQGEQ